MKAVEYESLDNQLRPDVITARWPFYQGLSLVALVVVLAAGYAAAVVVTPGEESTRQLAIMTTVLVLSGVIAIEFAQRAYRFEPGRIGVRHLGFWRYFELPLRVEVFVHSDGSFAVDDASDGPFRIYVPKDVARASALGAKVTQFYARHHRLAEEAS